MALQFLYTFIVTCILFGVVGAVLKDEPGGKPIAAFFSTLSGVSAWGVAISAICAIWS